MWLFAHTLFNWSRIWGFTHCSSILEFQVSLRFSFWDFVISLTFCVHHWEHKVLETHYLSKIIMIMWWRIRLRFLLWLLWAVMLLFIRLYQITLAYLHIRNSSLILFVFQRIKFHSVRKNAHLLPIWWKEVSTTLNVNLWEHLKSLRWMLW